MQPQFADKLFVGSSAVGKLPDAVEQLRVGQLLGHTRDYRGRVKRRRFGWAVIVKAMELKSVRLTIPENGNIIVGQSHFIKTVEDIYEAVVNTSPHIQFGVAFNEASGPCLIRFDGNDEELKKGAIENAKAIGAGHSFVVLLRNGFPINVLGRIQSVPEVVNIYCATANPVEMIVAETEQGRGILGVIDGSSPKGVESDTDAKDRVALLQKFGYKR